MDVPTVPPAAPTVLAHGADPRATSTMSRAMRFERAVIHAGLAWVRRWGISIGSFVMGALTLFVFRRGLPHVQWIAGYVILLWLLFAILTQVRQALEERGRRLVVTAVDYVVQSLYHGLLLFMLPAYYASTTLASVNVVFLGVLIVLTVLATFDPWYQAVVQPRPWLGLAFFVISIFGALNVALPLVGVVPHTALLVSAWIATVALTPVVRREGVTWSRALAVTMIGGLAAAGVAHAARIAIPPAPISLARATMARDVAGLDPVGVVSGALSADVVRADGLVAYSAVYAPAPLRQPLVHVWRHRGRVVSVVMLSAVQGGRREGFRTFSRKTSFPADPTGSWSVDVMTASGQLIGRIRFRITQ